MSYLITVFFIALSFVQPIAADAQASPNSKRRVNASQSRAESTWNEFFISYRQIVSQRNREKLRSILSSNFSGIDWTVSPADFEIYWERLEGLGKTSGLLKSGIVAGCCYIKNPTKFVGEYWSTSARTPCSENDGRENWARFEYRRGKWLMVELGFCEHE